MKPKKLFYTIFIFMMSLTITAQEYKKVIKNEFNEYMTFIEAKNFKKALDFVLPESFQIIPKAQLLKLLEQSYNDPSYKIEFKNSTIFDIGDVQKFGKKYYSLLNYSTQMDMKIMNTNDLTAEGKKTLIDHTISVYQKVYGADNVRYNSGTDFFEIIIQRPVYAISNDGKINWKFLVVEKQQMSMLEKLLPKELIDKI
ncbi:hypothetical protein [Flavobacterium sp. GCM10023249]|uniref:hypothetical protein n=1 Tax=unclassified Flavobacterium TaxID=196869 RepID=UPI00361E883C